MSEDVAGRRGRKAWPEGVVGRRGRKAWSEDVAERRGRKAWSENLLIFKSREELSFAEIFFDLKRTRMGTCERGTTDPVQQPTPITFPTGSVSPACTVPRVGPRSRRSWSTGSISLWTLSCSITQVSTSARTLGTSVTQITLQMF